MANEQYVPGKYFIGFKLGFRNNTKTKLTAIHSILGYTYTCTYLVHYI